MGCDYLVNIDWLAVSLVGCDVAEPYYDGIRFSLVGSTPVWGELWRGVNEFGELVFSYLCKPISSILRPDAGLLEVANEWLYRGISHQVLVDTFCSVNSLVCVGVSRVDLACDFVCDEAKFSVLSELSEGCARVEGKRNMTVFRSSSTDWRLADAWRGVMIPHQLQWGHKTSSVKWKVYYKWKELTEAAGAIGWVKPYIVDTWRKAGYDVTKVWRCEVSIKHSNKLAWDGTKMTLEDYCQYTAYCFWLLYKKRFVIRKNDGHVNGRLDEELKLLQVPDFDGSIKCIVPISSQVSSVGTTQLRRLIMDLDEDGVKNNERLLALTVEHIMLMTQDKGLYAYGSKVVGEDLTTYINKKTQTDGTETKKAGLVAGSRGN